MVLWQGDLVPNYTALHPASSCALLMNAFPQIIVIELNSFRSHMPNYPGLIPVLDLLLVEETDTILLQGLPSKAPLPVSDLLLVAG